MKVTWFRYPDGDWYCRAEYQGEVGMSICSDRRYATALAIAECWGNHITALELSDAS